GGVGDRLRSGRAWLVRILCGDVPVGVRGLVGGLGVVLVRARRGGGDRGECGLDLLAGLGGPPVLGGRLGRRGGRGVLRGAAAPTAATPSAVVRSAAAGLLDGVVVDDEAATTTVLAGGGERLDEPLADPLAGHLHETERGHLGHL